MSPLSEAIYHVLAARAKLPDPLISYSQLVKELPLLDPPYDQVRHDDKRLFEALGKAGHFCLQHGLPSLTALVIRSIDKTPGKGYFQMFHPEVGDDPDRQREAWEHALEEVTSADYSELTLHTPAAKPTGNPEHPQPQQSNQLGILHIADATRKPGTIFTGYFTCNVCSKTIDIEVTRNSQAFSEKQPAFLILKPGSTSQAAPLGHLFIGTILSSPILYRSSCISGSYSGSTGIGVMIPA